MRSWHLLPAGPGRFTGTLTDANGPVVASVAGPRLDIAYPMKGGLKAVQVLTLRPDGKTLDNELTVTKFGVQLARVGMAAARRGSTFGAATTASGCVAFSASGAKAAAATAVASPCFAISARGASVRGFLRKKTRPSASRVRRESTARRCLFM